MVKRKELQELLQRLKEKALEECTDHDTWLRRRGEVSMLAYILALEEAEKYQLENLASYKFTDELPPDDGGNSLES